MITGKPPHPWLPPTIAVSLHTHSRQQAKCATLEVLNPEEQPLPPMSPQQEENHRWREFLGVTLMSERCSAAPYESTCRSCFVSSPPWVASAFTDPQSQEENDKRVLKLTWNSVQGITNTWLGSLSRPGWKENKLFSCELEKRLQCNFLWILLSMPLGIKTKERKIWEISLISVLWIFM